MAAKPHPLTTDAERAHYLNLLADHLDRMPVDKIDFDLESWGSTPEDNACGTTACAMGYACLVPEFQKRGLKLMVGERVARTVAGYNRFMTRGRPFALPVFDHGGGWNAITAFWGLSETNVSWLFDEDSYNDPTRENVIKRLRELAEELTHD